MGGDTALAPPGSQDAFRFILQGGLLSQHLTLREIAMVRMVSRDWETWGAHGQPLVLQAVIAKSDQAARVHLLQDALMFTTTRCVHELLRYHGPQLLADDIEGLSERKHTFLHVAAGAASVPKMRLLLQHGWTPLLLQPTLTAKALSCLHIAALAGNTPMVTALVQAADHVVAELLLARDFRNYTGLHAAAFAGHADTVRVLLSAAARVGVQAHMLVQNDYKLRSALHLAVQSGCPETVQALLETVGIGGLLTLEDFRDQNCLHVAARGQSVHVMKALLRAAENEDVLARMLLSRDQTLGSCLHEAASSGPAAMIGTLLEAAERVHVRAELVLMKNEREMTCLDVAVLMDAEENVEALVSGIAPPELGALLVSKSENGENCVLKAVRGFCVWPLYAILDAAGRVCGLLETLLASEDSAGNNLLYLAVTQKIFEHDLEVQVLMMLLDASIESARALLLKKTKTGSSILYCAIEREKPKAARYLWGFAYRLGVLEEILPITNAELAANGKESVFVYLMANATADELASMNAKPHSVYSKVLGRVL